MSPNMAGSLAGAVSGAAGLVVLLSGIFAGVARAYAVLSEASSDEVERTTAVGFLAGVVIALLVLGADLCG